MSRLGSIPIMRHYALRPSRLIALREWLVSFPSLPNITLRWSTNQTIRMIWRIRYRVGLTISLLILRLCRRQSLNLSVRHTPKMKTVWLCYKLLRAKALTNHTQICRYADVQGYIDISSIKVCCGTAQTFRILLVSLFLIIRNWRIVSSMRHTILRWAVISVVRSPMDL